MHRQVLEPLGMVRSFFSQPPPPGAFKYLATGYFADGKPLPGKFNLYPEQAADGLWTNPSDLSKFIIELQLSLQGKSNRVLSREMATTMVTPYIDKSAALGVFITDDKKYFSHPGANVGFRGIYYGSMEGGNGVVVMLNSDNGNIMYEIVNSVATVYGWKDLYKPEIRTTVKVPADTLKAYVGEYKFPNGLATILQKGNDLYIKDPGGAEFKMYFISNTRFFVYEVKADAEFVRNRAGAVEAFLLKQNGGEFKAMKQ